MNIYIFQNIEQLTGYYHSGGGLVVIAPNLDAAIGLAMSDGVTFSDREIEHVITHALADANTEPRVFIFPDAGCC